jgi:hypothetical protein
MTLLDEMVGRPFGASGPDGASAHGAGRGAGGRARGLAVLCRMNLAQLDMLLRLAQAIDELA